MRHVGFVLLLIACGAANKPQSATPAPAATPVAAPAPAPKAEPQEPVILDPGGAETGVLVARGGDPCEGGEVTSSGGLGLSGTGTGGGGTGEGAIGLGSIGTIGHGSGTGAGAGGIRNRVAASPKVKLVEQHATAGLDVAIIKRFIRRDTMKFLYCYEKELMKDPSLAGQVALDFTIELDGKVLQATAKGFSQNVDRCLVEVMQRMEFPKPTRKVEVSYLSLFSQPD
jgi:hypothetical protein